MVRKDRVDFGLHTSMSVMLLLSCFLLSFIFFG